MTSRTHLLGIRGLTKLELEQYLLNAQNFVEVSGRDIKKVPALRGKTIVNLFLEASTRTRVSFEIAGKRLSADTINITGSESSVSKGETLMDTVRTLQAMAPEIIVMRHPASGAAAFVARHLSRSSVVNAGDGMHEHPTQALLDCLTLIQHFKDRPKGIYGLKIAIVGDVRHSRVARSNVWAHLLLGNEIRLVGPRTLLPTEFSDKKCFGDQVSLHTDLAEGIKGADVVLTLRMQLERQQDNLVPSLDEYSQAYGISERVLAKYAPDSVVLHPGPVNRGTEISGEVVDGPRSLIEKQVTHGVAVRMAVLFALGVGHHEEVVANEAN